MPHSRSALSVNVMFVGLFALMLGLSSAQVMGQASAHYVPGLEGIKGASLPPPGLYLRDYNLAYASDRLNDADGDEIGVADFSAFVYAQAPRVLWITDTKIFGGNLGFDALGVVGYQSVEVNTPLGKFDDSQWSLGDPFVEATLSWHLQQFDFAVGAGEWIPAGDTEFPPTTKLALGYWGTMFTAGMTWYPDAEKTWAVSLLNRYEINREQRDTGITPGDAWTLEWGVSKALNKTVDLGLIGYYQQQVTDDDGAGGSSDLDRVAGVGPEVSLAFPSQMIFVSVRYAYEFWAESRAQGHTVTVTLTHRF